MNFWCLTLPRQILGGLPLCLGLVICGCSRDDASNVSQPNVQNAQVKAIQSDRSDWQADVTVPSSWRVTASSPANESDSLTPSEDGFVGAQACRECHAEQFDAFAQTTHAQSFRRTQVESEPKPDQLRHAKSSREYEIIRDGGQMIHSEKLLDVQGNVILQNRFPIKYTVGSGQHAYTYAIERDGYLLESPLSWFREADRWTMSPGYDQPYHQSFTRAITADCLFCHVGRLEDPRPRDGRLTIVEEAIGCERCHGPGGDHVAHYQDVSNSGVSEDSPDTIVHPAKLSRDASEAICQQCHLQGAEVVFAPQQDRWDFRPGQSLSANRTDYQISGDSKFKIVAHVEQMHQSRCYLDSDTMTCTTCHDPHHRVLSTDRVTHYRNACLSCHAGDACGLDVDHRLAENDNDCSNCHMPKAKTNVTHASLHQHRIAVYRDDDVRPTSEDDLKLFAILSDQGIDAAESSRREVIAVDQYIPAHPQASLDGQLESAIERLDASTSDDPQILLVKARQADQLGDLARAYKLASQAYKRADPASQDSFVATELLAKLVRVGGNLSAAAKLYQSLTLRRHSAVDHQNLGQCYLMMNRIDDAAAEFEKTLVIEPDNAKAHDFLQRIFTVSQPIRAIKHQRVLEALRQGP